MQPASLVSLLSQRAFVVAGAGLFLLLAGGCDSDRQVVATEPPGQEQLVPEDAGFSDSGTGGLCPTTECPAGWISCPSNPFPCAVDLLSDDNNCGACGNHCPVTTTGTFSFDEPLPLMIHASLGCVDGACRIFACDRDYADCNGFIEDGCEVNLEGDSKNCGACGNVCPDQHACTDGVCECAVAGSCGACGELCPPATEPQPPFPEDWHAGYGCIKGECNKAGCALPWNDCNQNFRGIVEPGGDGCEVDVGSDSQNCGSCGNACSPGERCVDGRCVCQCGWECSDVGGNPDDCGACGNRCPGTDANGSRICVHGVCGFQCLKGWFDCDNNIWTGCETNIMQDPHNCGGCGIRCEGVDGQACVDGRCTTKGCIVQ